MAIASNIAQTDSIDQAYPPKTSVYFAALPSRPNTIRVRWWYILYNMITVRTVTAVRLIKEMPRSSSHALLVKCDDGKKYVLKHKKNNQSVCPSSIFIAELICYLIAVKFNLNIPEICFIRVGKQIQKATEDKRICEILKASSGINIGSMFFKDAEPVEVPDDLEKALNYMHFQIIYGFDEYVYNIDRMPDNPNLLISRDKREIWLIDHSATVWPARNADLRSSTSFSGEHILFPYLSNDFSQFAGLVESIGELIENMLSIIPTEWFNDELSAQYLREFLSARRNNIQTIIRSAIYGRTNIRRHRRSDV